MSEHQVYQVCEYLRKTKFWQVRILNSPLGTILNVNQASILHVTNGPNNDPTLTWLPHNFDLYNLRKWAYKFESVLQLFLRPVVNSISL